MAEVGRISRTTGTREGTRHGYYKRRIKGTLERKLLAPQNLHKTSTPQTQRVLQAAPFGPPNEPPPAPSRRQPPPPNSGVAHRGRLLKADADAAARSVFERLFGLVSNPVASEPGSEGQDGNGESKRVSMGADTKANTTGEAAHLRLVIFVSLRMAASAVAPRSPMLLPQRLQGKGDVARWGYIVRGQACQCGLTRKQTLRGRRRTRGR